MVKNKKVKKVRISKGKKFFNNLEDKFFRSDFNPCDAIIDRIFKAHKEKIEEAINSSYKYYKKVGFIEGFHKSFRQVDILPSEGEVSLDMLVWHALHGSEKIYQALKEL